MAPKILLASSYCLLLSLVTYPLVAAAKAKPLCPTVSITTHFASCPAPTHICIEPDCILLDVIDIPCGCPEVVPTSTVFTPCPTACHGGCGTAYKTQRESCSKPTSTKKPVKPTCDCSRPRPQPLEGGDEVICNCPFQPAPTTTLKPICDCSHPRPQPLEGGDEVICNCPFQPAPTTTPTTTLTTVTTTDSCFTVTQTTGSTCPQHTGCIVADCIIQKTATNSCGCTGIPTKTVCASACPAGCATEWVDLFLPCPTSPPPVKATPVPL
ncbi:hypothetical protein B7463_g8294, partial [Scytalidium lignicola]